MAKLLIEATVKDSAGHSETRGEPITVSELAFLVTAIPEGGTLVPKLENQIFLLAAYPDGTPVEANLTVHSSSQPDVNVTADSGGVAVITLKPLTSAETLTVRGRSKEGESVTTTVPLELRGREEQVLLHAEHAVYRAGDGIRLKILSTKTKWTVYVDVEQQQASILPINCFFRLLWQVQAHSRLRNSIFILEPTFSSVPTLCEQNQLVIGKLSETC